MADFRAPNPFSEETSDTVRPQTTQPATSAWRTTAPSDETNAPKESTTRRPTAPPPSEPVSSPMQNRRSPFTLLGRALRLLILSALAAAALVVCLILAYRWITPPTSTLMLGQRLTGTEISQTWRSLSSISPSLARAVIMSEDAGFCRHRGVDWRELEAAYERGQDGGIAGGGSTISMQVTKNLFLWPSRSYLRKALEIPLTLLSEVLWSKPRILEFYLNIAEWGPGIFGAEAAARAYFNKPASALTEREAALLATALPNPLVRNPKNPSDLHRRLGVNIENRMRSATAHTQCLLRPSRP